MSGYPYFKGPAVDSIEECARFCVDKGLDGFVAFSIYDDDGDDGCLCAYEYGMRKNSSVTGCPLPLPFCLTFACFTTLKEPAGSNMYLPGGSYSRFPLQGTGPIHYLFDSVRNGDCPFVGKIYVITSPELPSTLGGDCSLQDCPLYRDSTPRPSPPPLQCDEHESKIKVEIQTDYYSGEFMVSLFCSVSPMFLC